MSLPEPTIRIAALCGSLRSVSHTRHALEVALHGAEALGAEIHLLDLREYDIPFCDGSRPIETLPDSVKRLRQDLKQAQGILLGTPVYHGSFSGVLKNALDWMRFEEFGGKIVGLVSVSGGQMGGIDALNSLRSIGRALHAWVIPDQVAIPQAWQIFDEKGELSDTALRERLYELGRQVVRFAYLHTSDETLEFLRAWENAPPNPGGG